MTLHVILSPLWNRVEVLQALSSFLGLRAATWEYVLAHRLVKLARRQA